MSRWIIASSVLTLVVFGTWIWLLANPGLFPERVPIHWGIDNEPNGWTDAHNAIVSLVFAPILMLLAVGLSFAIPSVSPKPFTNPVDRRRLDYVLMLVVALFAWLFFVIANAMRTTQLQGTWLIAPLFLLFALMGPGMRGVPRNGLFGVRTPWTLASDEVWTRTHAMTAHFWLATGILGVILCLAPVPFWVPLLLLLPLGIVPAVYSYRISKT